MIDGGTTRWDWRTKLDHTLLAAGAGIYAALVTIGVEGEINWRAVAIAGGTTLLAGLGVGVAKRASP